MNKILQDQYINECKSWLQNFVIGLGLCPFARQPFIQHQIRYVVIDHDDIEQQLIEFWNEVICLKDSDPVAISTTLLIFPKHLKDFREHLDFFDLAEALLEDQNEYDHFQLASFHPHYHFDDTEYDDVSNYTNRSPFPILHILRTDEVARAIEEHPDTSKIPERNIELMIKMGEAKLLQLLKFKEIDN